MSNLVRPLLAAAALGIALSAGTAASLAAPPAPAAPTGGKWTEFRGSPRQLGIAAGRLPSALKLAWKVQIGTKAVNAPWVTSAVVGQGRVYACAWNGTAYALSQKDGKKLWSYKLGGHIEAPPCLDGSSVLVSADNGILYSLDAATGKLRWKYETEDKILGSANVVPAPTGQGTWVLIGSYDTKVHCVRGDTGKRVWTCSTDNYVNGTPAVSDGRVLFGGCDGVIRVVNLLDGKQIRTVDVSDYIAASAAAEGSQMFVGHYGNAFICADVVTGKIVWTYRDKAFPFFSSPAVLSDRIVVGSRDKSVHCISRADGSSLWKFRTRGKVDSSPVVCDGKIVVGSEDGRIYLLNLANGQQLSSYLVGAPVMSSPAVVDGAVYMGANDGFIYAFRG